MKQKNQTQRPKTLWITWVLAIGLLGFGAQQLACSIRNHHEKQDPSAASAPPTARKPSSKIRIDGEKQYLWAKGSKDPASKSSEWFDMSHSPVALQDVRHGIGKDTIPSIDDPVFVAPDDPALLQRWHVDDLSKLQQMRVIGYTNNGDARAYPIRLLNRHELVNDTVGGKPVTVGW